MSAEENYGDQIERLTSAALGKTVEIDGRVYATTELHDPNPVQLAPYLTFLEVEQPVSPFILRLRGGSQDKPPTCALFEADGGAWQLEAIKRVKAWLHEQLGNAIDVFG